MNNRIANLVNNSSEIRDIYFNNQFVIEQIF